MTTSIYDVDDSGYIYETALRLRAAETRIDLIASGAILPKRAQKTAPEAEILREKIITDVLSSYPTLCLEPRDARHITRHIHEGAWTIGMHEEDLPGFVPEELGR